MKYILNQKCPVCTNGKLKNATKFGVYNLASKKMLECNFCYSNFPKTEKLDKPK